jgi:hypothetical protein
VRLAAVTLKHPDLPGEVKELMDYFLGQIKSSQFIVDNAKQTQRDGEKDSLAEKLKMKELLAENEALQKELKQKKELLDHVAREKRKNHKKTLQEIEPSQLLKRISDLEGEVKEKPKPKNSFFWVYLKSEETFIEHNDR